MIYLYHLGSLRHVSTLPIINDVFFMKCKISNKEFEELVYSSNSIREVIEKMGLKSAGGNYASFHNRVKRLSLDISHFSKDPWNKGQKFGPQRELSEYFSNKYSITSHKLRRRLIREGYFEHKCSKCLNDIWMGSPMPLELNHIDGNHLNNSLNNLEIICPNCHALTPNYRGKNIGNHQ